MNIVAFDFETYLIGPDAIAPKPVVLSTYDGVDTRLFVGPAMEVELRRLLLSTHKLVGHNVSFDLSVIFEHMPSLRDLLFDVLKAGRVSDTLLRQKLFDLSTEGTLPGPYTLIALEKIYLKRDRSSEKSKDSWRMRYSELDGVPLEAWPEEARKYAVDDAVGTLEVWQQQELIREDYREGSMNTEALQVSSAFCLRLMTLRGLAVDGERAEASRQKLELEVKPLHETLVLHDMASFDKKTGKLKKKTAALQKHLFFRYSEYVQYTDKGNIKLDKEALDSIPADDEITTAFKAIKNAEKLLTAYYPRLIGVKSIHPDYDVLKETGRTSSYCSSLYPSINIQQLPRSGDVRSCFIPRPGYVFIAVDYCALEVCSWAQVLYSLLGFSNMRDLLNSGDSPVDIHTRAAADIGCDRQTSKPFTLGRLGGLSDKTMPSYAAKLGIKGLTLEKAAELYQKQNAAYPEIPTFFSALKDFAISDREFAYETRGRYRTKCTYCAAANGIAMQSLSADGAKMAVCRVAEECYGKGGLGTLSGCHPVAFIHDEIIIEAPEADYQRFVEALSNIMITTMLRVMPDIRISVEASVMTVWNKKGPFIAESRAWAKKGETLRYEEKLCSNGK